MLFKGLFMTQSNIYDGAFWRLVNGFKPLTILEKSSMIDVGLASKTFLVEIETPICCNWLNSGSSKIFIVIVILSSRNYFLTRKNIEK